MYGQETEERERKIEMSPLVITILTLSPNKRLSFPPNARANLSFFFCSFLFSFLFSV
jgi:hypothetical protein